MVTKEFVKHELDALQDEYVEVVYRVIKALEMRLIEFDRESYACPIMEQAAWEAFVDRYAGCLSDTTIERGEQGVYEIREALR